MESYKIELEPLKIEPIELEMIELEPIQMTDYLELNIDWLIDPIEWPIEKIK